MTKSCSLCARQTTSLDGVCRLCKGKIRRAKIASVAKLRPVYWSNDGLVAVAVEGFPRNALIPHTKTSLRFGVFASGDVFRDLDGVLWRVIQKERVPDQCICSLVYHGRAEERKINAKNNAAS